MVHAFADCELDEQLFQLRRGSRVVAIEPKVFDVLSYLLRHRDRVVTKEELLDAIWGGQAVSESVLPKCINVARRAVGDGRTRQQIIQTVHGRGYRFIATVTQRDPAIAAAVPLPPPIPEPRSRSPFVGRGQIMERLRDGMAAASAGRGHVFLLVGEPGIGKTRLAEELGMAAREQHRALFVVGRAYEGEGAPAFWPWVQILRGCLETLEPQTVLALMGAGAADIATLIPELRERMRRGPSPEPMEGEAARFRLFESVTTFLQRVAARQPLAIVLDDLHWADEASLHLLRFVAGAVNGTRLLLVATYRDVEVRRGHPLADVLGGLARESTCERIALRGFGATDSRLLVEGITGASASAAVAAAVHEMTDGNPFFIHEVVRLLVADGGVTATQGAAPAELLLPQGVRDAIGRRLDRLSAECNAVLRVAAVLGRDFGVPLLTAAASVPSERLLEALDEAHSAGIVDACADGIGRFAFHHALIRQTLYEELSTPERVRLHRQAATALERLSGADIDTHLDQLAHHLFESVSAGDAVRAVDACTRAAARAFALLAYEQSARHYACALQAFELLETGDDLRRCELLLALGEAHAASGARAKARAAFERAAEVARRLERVDLLARAALGYRGAEMGTPAEESTLALLEEALAQLTAHPALRACVMSRLVGTPPYSNSMDTRDRMSREALALARESGDTRATQEALIARLWACLGPDRVAERLEVAEQLLGLAAREQSTLSAFLAQEAAFGAHLLRGDMAAADRTLAAYTHLADELRQPAYIFLATFFRGSRAMARGEFDEAAQLFRSALERGRGTMPFAHFMYAGQMYVLLYLRGEIDDPELNRIFFGEMMELPYSFAEAMKTSLAFALFLRGDVEGSRQTFNALAARGFETIRHDEHWLVTIGTLSSVAIMLDDRARAAQLYELLRPYDDLMVVHDLLRSIGGSVASSLGGLATVLGRYDVAAAHFEKALAKESAVSPVIALTDSRPGLVRLLFKRNQRGDRKRAEAELREVIAEMAARGIRRNWTFLVLQDVDGVAIPGAEQTPFRPVPRAP
jgi:predicted ATPase/DNA-binding winged helix-turn-helix (wHTH) protein